MMKKVLIMGGSLFIGLEIVHKLIEKGYDITVCNRGNNPLNLDTVKEIQVDREDSKELNRHFQELDFDFVIDVSALNKNHVKILYETLNKKKLKNYIFISSGAVYKNSSTLPFQEDRDIGENKYWKDYGLNKIEAEEFLKEKFKKENFPFIVLRPPYVYGPNNYIYREAYLFERILEDKKIIIPKDGETKVQFIHVSDLANMVITLLEREDLVGNIYNASNKEYITFREWVNIAMEVTGKEVEVVNFDNDKYNFNSRDFFPFYDYDYYLSTNKLDFIYKSKISFEEGMKDSLKWYLKNNKKVAVKEHIYNNEKKIMNLFLNSTIKTEKTENKRV